MHMYLHVWVTNLSNKVWIFLNRLGWWFHTAFVHDRCFLIRRNVCIFLPRYVVIIPRYTYSCLMPRNVHKYELSYPEHKM
jgi:hypothetical protein